MLVRPVAILLAVLSGFSPHQHNKQFHQTVQERIEASEQVPGVQVAELESFMKDLNTYIQQLTLNDYLAAIEASKEAEAAAARAAMATPRDYTPSSTVGECTGFAIPDYIIQRESGGNPSAYNPSGAYGCAQTLLSHYAVGGSCSGLDPYSIQGQRDCVAILSNGGTNLAPWALTR